MSAISTLAASGPSSAKPSGKQVKHLFVTTAVSINGKVELLIDVCNLCSS